MTGFHTYNDDDLVDADTMNEYIRDQVVTIFSSEASRDSAITSPFHGQAATVAAGSTPPVLYQYDGSTSAWVQVGGSTNPVTYAWLNETHTKTSTATPESDNKLTLDLLPSKTYAIDAWLITNADSDDTVNLRVTWAWTGDTVTGARWCNGPAPTIPSTDQANAVDLAVFQTFTGLTDEVVYAAAVNGVSMVHDRIVIRTPAGGGNIALAWAQGTSASDPLHLYAPSHLRAEYSDVMWTDPIEIG